MHFELTIWNNKSTSTFDFFLSILVLSVLVKNSFVFPSFSFHQNMYFTTGENKKGLEKILLKMLHPVLQKGCITQ